MPEHGGGIKSHRKHWLEIAYPCPNVVSTELALFIAVLVRDNADVARVNISTQLAITVTHAWNSAAKKKRLLNKSTGISRNVRVRFTIWNEIVNNSKLEKHIDTRNITSLDINIMMNK